MCAFCVLCAFLCIFMIEKDMKKIKIKKIKRNIEIYLFKNKKKQKKL